MAATKIAASTGVSAARYGRKAGFGSACPITKHPACSWRDLPGGAFLGIFDENAHRGQFVPDTIGFLEVFSLACGGTSGHKRFYLCSVKRNGFIFSREMPLCQKTPDCLRRTQKEAAGLGVCFCFRRQFAENCNGSRRIQVIAQGLEETRIGFTPFDPVGGLKDPTPVSFRLQCFV